MTENKLEFPDEPGHPIPCVYTYDTALTFDGGGAYLGIVIATPLGADVQSLARLKEKLSFYLESLYSEFGRKEWGTPVQGKMKIYVRIHPNSSDETFKILNIFNTEEAAPRGVQLIISEIP